MGISMTDSILERAELVTPNLSPVEHAALLLACNSTILGTGEVTVSLTYKKQTKAKARVAGRDYVAMPGVSPASFIGQIKLVGRNKKGVPYIFVPSMTRGNGSDPSGPTCLTPAGIQSFVVMGFSPRTPAPAEKQTDATG